MNTLLFDFQFRDDGRLVRCTRHLLQPTAGDGVDGTMRVDGGWWCLAVEDAAPVRLREVQPGETRQDVWESALHYLDASV